MTLSRTENQSSKNKLLRKIVVDATDIIVAAVQIVLLSKCRHFQHGDFLHFVLVFINTKEIGLIRKFTQSQNSIHQASIYCPIFKMNLDDVFIGLVFVQLASSK